MEIECPPQAIAIWIIADEIHIRFPDRQLITIPATQPGRLINLLRTREHWALEGRRPSVGTKAAPVQWDIEQETNAKVWLEAINKSGAELRARDVEREEREKRRLDKKATARREREEAEKFLADIGL